MRWRTECELFTVAPESIAAKSRGKDAPSTSRPHDVSWHRMRRCCALHLERQPRGTWVAPLGLPAFAVCGTAQTESQAYSTIQYWRPGLKPPSDLSLWNGAAVIMIHSQPVPTRLYNVTGVAAQIARDAGHRETACPRCNASVVRIYRRFVDRMVSMIHPVRRYRCQSFICRWEGNIADDAQPSGRKQSGPSPRAKSETWKWVQLQSGRAE